MGAILFFSGIFAWLVVGWTGYVYWWTKDWDLDGPDLAFSFFIMFLGPGTWFFGYLIHGNKDRIIIRKRDK